jgi:hypothetical protein
MAKPKPSSRRRANPLTNPVWGRALRQRGEPWHPYAVALSEHWPQRPTRFSVQSFDSFAAEQGVYKIPVGARPGTPLWAHVIHQRSRFKKGLNAAGSHPRMDSHEDPLISPFEIRVIVPGRTWEITSPDLLWKDVTFFEHLTRLLAPTRQYLKWRYQGVRWDRMQPYAPYFAEALMKRYDNMSERTIHELVSLQREMIELADNLEQATPADG